MKKISTLLLVFVIIFFLSNCNQRKELSSVFVGEWSYKSTIFYSEKLILSDNGNFIFYNKTCFGTAYTEGKWFNNDSCINLSSYSNYKQFSTINIAQLDVPSSGDTSRIYLNKIFEPDQELSISFPDTTKLYFDRINLKLNKDTLYYLGDNPILN